MVTAQTTPAFNRGLDALIRQAGLNARVVIAKETGELIKTLVRTSPPKNPPKTKENIANTIRSRFEMIGNESLSGTGYSGKVGRSGILWYGIDSQFLRGIAPKNDQRGASVEQLRQLYYRITKTGRLNLPFKHPRKNQRVLIYQTVLTKKSTATKLISKIKQNVGRLKAGWLVASVSGPIKLTGGNLPPAFVTRHVSGARGAFIDDLAAPNFPRFTIINTAKGIGQKQVAGIIKTSLAIRGKAMQKNALLFMRGKKQLSDYR